MLGWQLIPGFKVDPASGVPAPVKTYAVSATVVGGHGTAVADPATVEAGGSCTITLTPAAGYWMRSITDNGADVSGAVVGSAYTITGITSDHTVVVTYTNGTHTLTYSAGAHGSISGSITQTVADGADGSAVVAAAADGYHFAAWTDGSTANPRTDTAVAADVTVKAIFLPDDAATTRPWDHFTIAVLPDTQYYSETYPAIFDDQTQWIADHAKAENIVFVSQLGDLVDTYNSASQWQHARDSMADRPRGRDPVLGGPGQSRHRLRDPRRERLRLLVPLHARSWATHGTAATIPRPATQATTSSSPPWGRSSSCSTSSATLRCSRTRRTGPTRC